MKKAESNLKVLIGLPGPERTVTYKANINGIYKTISIYITCPTSSVYPNKATISSPDGGLLLLAADFNAEGHPTPGLSTESKPV